MYDMNESKIDIGIDKTLRKLRKEHGLNQGQVSMAIGMKRPTYAYYELGKTMPDIRTLLKLCRVYNITLDEMLGMKKTGELAVSAPSEEYLTERMKQKISTLSKYEQNLLICSRMLNEEQREDLISYIKEKLDFDIIFR